MIYFLGGPEKFLPTIYAIVLLTVYLIVRVMMHVL